MSCTAWNQEKIKETRCLYGVACVQVTLCVFVCAQVSGPLVLISRTDRVECRLALALCEWARFSGLICCVKSEQWLVTALQSPLQPGNVSVCLERRVLRFHGLPRQRVRKKSYPVFGLWFAY